MKNIVIIVCIVSLLAVIAGCTSSNTDPLVGTWKQEMMGIMTITMELNADGTGTITTDMSALGPGTESGPAVISSDIKWKQVNDTFVNIYYASDMSSQPLLYKYDKNNNLLLESYGSGLNFHKV